MINMKPHIHAENSVKKFGGVLADYLKIHQWFDATKEQWPDNRHRALRHHTFGIFDAERVFGPLIVNSDSKNVSVRDIGEQHVLEDLGFIPTVSDYFQHLSYENWMHGDGKPKKPDVLIKKLNFDDIKVEKSELIVYDGSNIDLLQKESERIID